MPENGIQLVKHEEVLSFEEIIEFTRISVAKGISKVRITGGEPLVKRGIVKLVHEIALIKGIEELTLTTNGILLEEFAQPLKDAGLSRINISLDTIDSNKYKEITRGGDINLVFKGIAAAQKAELTPIKINCVVTDSSSEPDAISVKEYCKLNNMQVRFIHRMELSEGKFSVVEGGDGGNCKNCNKLRLTSEGNILPCLFSDITFNIRKLGAEKALQLALNAKPECGTTSLHGAFNKIGG